MENVNELKDTTKGIKNETRMKKAQDKISNNISDEIEVVQKDQKKKKLVELIKREIGT